MPEIPTGYGPPVLYCSRVCDVVPLVTLGEKEWKGECETCGADVLIMPEKWKALRDQWSCNPTVRCSPCGRMFDDWVPNQAKRRRQLHRAPRLN